MVPIGCPETSVRNYHNSSVPSSGVKNQRKPLKIGPTLREGTDRLSRNVGEELPQLVGLIFRGQESKIGPTLRDGTDRMSRNVGEELPQLVGPIFRGQESKKTLEDRTDP